MLTIFMRNKSKVGNLKIGSGCLLHYIVDSAIENKHDEDNIMHHIHTTHHIDHHYNDFNNIDPNMQYHNAFVGTIDECPEYMIDNIYLIRGYRIGFNTKLKILKSLCVIHNESINVWTHLIGVFVFIGLIIYTSIYIGNTTSSQ